jgi:hypothetical protein
MAAETRQGVDPRIRERDAGLRRLHRATALGLAAAGALSVVFGELAANAFSGRSSTTTTAVTTTTTGTSATATPPPLVSAGSAAQAAGSAAQAPTQSQAPPVAVSGGT